MRSRTTTGRWAVGLSAAGLVLGSVAPVLTVVRQDTGTEPALVVVAPMLAAPLRHGGPAVPLRTDRRLSPVDAVSKPMSSCCAARPSFCGHLWGDSPVDPASGGRPPIRSPWPT